MTERDAAGRPPRHQAVTGAIVRSASDDATARAVQVGAAAGPIAIVPDAEPRFAEAVTRAGGALAQLSADTRGLVWTSSEGEDELEALLAAHPQISWVQLPWAGVDAFAGLLRRHRDDGRVWTSAKGAYAQPVAEHALMLALAALRELPARVRAGEWVADERGRSLYGADIVLVGAGGIAVELLRLLEPFGVRATVVRRSDVAVPGAARTVTTDRLTEALSTAEVVFVVAALTDGTRGLIGRDELAALPDDAILVNVARGGLVDTAALVDALESGRLGGAGLDVTDPEPLPAGHPLWNAPNCIVTPHVADTEAMTVPLFAERVRANTAAFLGKSRFEGLIDLDAGY
ncbi:phosphoglycerate dehydrogenase-like enzyme [Agromyces flavus]|uniref:Phosphoglycerate dehydrogenase n=1 Tax=Agromyces flavus TaxID=589382 RepID=A0A1H1RYH0_9MICO|nr:D-isomer specific 2-hydroxyacid dehydrogenase family protein [Agromyces flavus]MCP2368909.1 phosphoglycerate dehydrogenase-like enzyme [Agromyces flavus]GGI48366.1 dihydrofolate reductase [Agromyces flavus]SDS40646.1 Phosphoglycerate dehydrogenase [Agromyces flavus]